MIEELLKLYQSFPKGASDYHKMDFILRRVERLGMLPPPIKGKVTVKENKDGSLFIPIWEWEQEEDENN